MMLIEFVGTGGAEAYAPIGHSPGGFMNMVSSYCMVLVWLQHIVLNLCRLGAGRVLRGGRCV